MPITSSQYFIILFSVNKVFTFYHILNQTFNRMMSLAFSFISWVIINHNNFIMSNCPEKGLHALASSQHPDISERAIFINRIFFS